MRVYSKSRGIDALMRILYIDCFSVFDASMLLSSLIDAGAKSDIAVADTKRMGIECKIACLCGDNKDIEAACISAIEELNIDYIVTSPVGLPSGTDGEVLALLEKSGIETLPCDMTTKKMEPSDAQFLIKISSECGPKPDMDILSVGYGAGGESDGEPNIIAAYIGEFGNKDMFCMYQEIQEFSEVSG